LGQNEYIADDRFANPEYFEWLKNMAKEKFAQHIENLKNQESWGRMKKATISDLKSLVHLALELWPGHTAGDLSAEFSEILAREDAAFFLACEGDAPIGFAQCQLRHDYVEGTKTSPVGYLEGIFVAEAHRKQGIAKRLLAACEGWAKEKGCTEFASDCELRNTESLRFHLSMGFGEAGRIICFAKRI
jgi:aminoglycoside 6'-N-acetyltransferase I